MLFLLTVGMMAWIFCATTWSCRKLRQQQQQQQQRAASCATRDRQA